VFERSDEQNPVGAAAPLRKLMNRWFGPLVLSRARRARRASSAFRKVAHAIGGLLLLLAAGGAQAALVTVTVEGVLDQVRDDFSLVPDLGVGDPFVASYTYDDDDNTTSSGRCPPASNCDTYVFPALPEIGFEFLVGGLRFGLDNASGPAVPLQITVADTPVGDELLVEIWEKDYDPGLGIVGNFLFTGGTGFLSSTALQDPSLEQTERAIVLLILQLDAAEGGGIRETYLRGSIASLRVVPEPAPLAFTCLVIGGLILVRRMPSAPIHEVADK
jgi:hypothetical protein